MNFSPLSLYALIIVIVHFAYLFLGRKEHVASCNAFFFKNKEVLW
jgi:hypothetical protein